MCTSGTNGSGFQSLSNSSSSSLVKRSAFNFFSLVETLRTSSHTTQMIRKASRTK